MPSNAVVVVPFEGSFPEREYALKRLELAEASIAGARAELLDVLKLEQLPAPTRSRIAERVRELEPQILAVASIARAIGGGL